MTRADFQAYKERSLNRFCYEVIKNEGADARREIARRIRKEINFAAVDPAVLERMSVEDTYNLESHVFCVQGYIPILVTDGLLAKALSFLINPLREVVLLYFFLDLKFTAIALLLKIPYTTVTYRFEAALTRLKDILESLINEEK